MSNKQFKIGDSVKIRNKKDIEGEVVGFYPHSQEPVVRTSAGHEWVVNHSHLEKTKGPK